MSDGQVQKGSSPQDRESDEVEATVQTPEETRELLDDVDELMDEIDDVLEENAEEFVKNYVQKGGQ
ncbi:MAG: ubiquitin-like protein Pup [Nitriliruptorales bacterium]|nr:ubiquitin-like protein Pup [Nitriliruptorales bacterium]